MTKTNHLGKTLLIAGSALVWTVIGQRKADAADGLELDSDDPITRRQVIVARRLWPQGRHRLYLRCEETGETAAVWTDDAGAGWQWSALRLDVDQERSDRLLAGATALARSWLRRKCETWKAVSEASDYLRAAGLSAEIARESAAAIVRDAQAALALEGSGEPSGDQLELF